MRQIKINSVTGSDTSIVPTSEMKNYLRVDHSVDDSLIADMVKQSRIVLENYISRDIISKTRTYYLDKSNGLIDIPFGPIASIESVTVDGSTATHTVVGLDKESIELDSSPSYVSSNQFPYTYEKIKINYTTSGISDTLIKNAIMQMVATFYDNRADFKTGHIISEIPMTSKQMVASFKSMFV
tara:strand:+ start:370 stop:918 length:549 start_codon:yes stop_codon:yes gene_type:complete